MTTRFALRRLASVAAATSATLVAAQATRHATDPVADVAATRPALLMPRDLVPKYAAQLDRLRAAGQPVDPPDVASWPRLPAGEANGADAVAEVGRLSRERRDAIRDARFPGDAPRVDLPLDDAERRRLADALAAVPGAARAAARIRAETRFDWGEPPHGDLLKTWPGDRRIAAWTTGNLIVPQALLDADAGRHRCVFEAIDALQALADGVASLGTVGPGLTALGYDAQAAELATAVAWDLRVGDAENAVSRADVERLRDALADRERPLVRLRAAYITERVASIDALRLIADAGEGRARSIASAYAALNGLNLLRFYEAVLSACDERDLATRAALWRRTERRPGWLGLWGGLMRPALILTPTTGRAEQARQGSDRERQVAAAALAVRLYRLDHAGAVPPTLDALVPAYLAAVPVDAVDLDRPLRYDAARRMLWARGPNGRDDEGHVEPPPASTREMLDASDAVYHLDPAEQPAWARLVR